MYLCVLADLQLMINEATDHVNVNKLFRDARAIHYRRQHPYATGNFQKGRVLAWLKFVQRESLTYFARNPHAQYAQIRLFVLRGEGESEADVLQIFSQQLPHLLTTERLLTNAKRLIEDLQRRRSVKIAHSVGSKAQAILAHKDFVAQLGHTREKPQDEAWKALV